MSNKLKNGLIGNQGFTIIELMIATTIFALVLVVVTSGIIQITNVYYKGVTETNTQNVARNIINDVSQSIQFSTSIGATTNNPVSGQSYALCIGGREYIYQLGDEVVSSPAVNSDQAYHGLVAVDGSANCGSGGAVPSNSIPNLQTTSSINGGEEFINSDMRLSEFIVSNINGGNLYTVTVQISYGADDLLISPTDPNGGTKCLGSDGDQFCATATLSTVVDARLQ